MNTIELIIKGRMRLYTGPSCWQELSDAESVAMMRLRGQVAHKRETLFAALKLLYKLPYSAQRWLFDERFLRRQGLDETDVDLTLRMGQLVLETLKWIGQDDADAQFVSRFRRYSFQYGSPRVLGRQLLNRRCYHGPSAGLTSCTFAEFMFAEIAFQKRDWAQLAAVLYRPAGAGSTPADRRQHFERHQVEARAKAFQVLDPALLERIAFSYGCTLLRLKKRFSLVFQESAPDDAQPAQPGNWLDVAISMVKLDATRVAEIEKLNLYLALKVLNEQIRQTEEMERKYEKMKTR